MKKKYKLIHPYRHHSYEIVKGLLKNNYDIEAIYGFYDKYNIGEKFNMKKLKGYYDSNISGVVKSYMLTNILFILNKLKIVSNMTYISYFQKRAMREINKNDTIIVLQDYCQEIINYCIKNNIDYIYDHIMPCGYMQREIIDKAVKGIGGSENYTDRYISKNKINSNYNNIKYSKIILNASKSTYGITCEVLGEKPINSYIIPYGNNFNFFKNSNNAYTKIHEKLANINKRRIKVLYVGSLSIIKGTHILIDIIKENYDFEFGIVGVPNSREDDKFIKDLICVKNVKYYGHIPHKEMWKIYLEYDIFIFTSLVEGFGMVTLEAMASGLPCIVNKFCPSIIEDKIDGFVVNDITSEEYTKKLMLLKSDLENLKQLSINAYNNSKKYSWENYINNFKNILDKE